MRYLYLALLAFSLYMLTGCAGFMQFLGGVVGSGGEDGGASGAAGGLVGGLLSTVFPWFSTAALAVTGIVEDVKRKKWKKVATVMVRSTKRILHEKPEYDKIPQILADEQDKEAVRPVVRQLKHKVESGG